MSSTPLRIAIVGGGPTGLALLDILSRNNIAATLYERDERFGDRAHLGGMLDLHIGTGQEAMKAAGILQHSRVDGEEMGLTDKSGERLLSHMPPLNAKIPARPEIDRTMLRRILVDGAPEGAIKWGHSFVSAVQVKGTQEWELTFANGHKTIVDLVVGADGARSRVRRVLSDAPILFTGISGVEMSFGPEVAAAHPELMKRIGKGSIYALEDYKMIMIQLNGSGRVHVYTWVASETANAHPVDRTEAIEYMLERFSDWAPWFRQVISLCDPKATYDRSIFMLPLGFEWEHRAGLTLLGDAMHLMTPFAGEGVNMGLLGSLTLGRAIVKVRDEQGTLADLDAAVSQYEAELREKAGVYCRLSDRNTKYILRRYGINDYIEFFKTVVENGRKAQE